MNIYKNKVFYLIIIMEKHYMIKKAYKENSLANATS